MTRLAMVLIVRNEERFLASHLAYHRALGVEKAFVYLDRCTDRSTDIAKGFDYVELIRRDRRADEAYMSTYQVGCLADALERVRGEGFEWLMHIDADEFAFGDNRRLWPFSQESADNLQLEASLPNLLRRATRWWRGKGRRVDQIVLRPLEVLPTPLSEAENFLDLHWFQDGGVLPRQILDPTTGQTQILDHWLGSHHGKSIVRVNADVVPASAHAWKRPDGRWPTTVHAGFHLHYVVTDWRHWLEKYRKFSEYPANWEKGKPVRFPKQAWKEATANMSQADAQAYFNRWVAAEADGLDRLSKSRAGRHLRKGSWVSDVLHLA